MPTFEQRLKAAREAAGLSQIDVEFESRLQLPEPMWVTQVKVSRLERGTITEAKADPLEIAFLAHVYKVALMDLSVTAADRLDQVRDVVLRNSPGRDAWLATPP